MHEQLSGAGREKTDISTLKSKDDDTKHKTSPMTNE